MLKFALVDYANIIFIFKKKTKNKRNNRSNSFDNLLVKGHHHNNENMKLKHTFLVDVLKVIVIIKILNVGMYST